MKETMVFGLTEVARSNLLNSAFISKAVDSELRFCPYLPFSPPLCEGKKGPKESQAYLPHLFRTYR